MCQSCVAISGRNRAPAESAAVAINNPGSGVKGPSHLPQKNVEDKGKVGGGGFVKRGGCEQTLADLLIGVAVSEHRT